MRAGGLTLFVFLAGTVHAQPQPADAVLVVPSGQPVTLQDVIWGQPGAEGLTARFRFVAPEISQNGGSVGFEVAIVDMDFLCDSYALPRVLTQTGPKPSQIIVSFAEEPVEFGLITDAMQFIETYSFDSNRCIWEGYHDE